MTFETVKNAQSRLASSGGQQLGTLLWWSLNANRIEHRRLVDLAVKHSLDDKYLPSEIKPTGAFRRACRHAATRLDHGLMLRPIAESETEVVVGLVRERPDAAAKNLDYDLLARISFDKQTSIITADVENGVLAQVRELYQHHLAHTTEDIRAMFAAFLAEAGVSLRESGGVYFVPATHQTTLDSLCAVVEAVGSNKTFQLPIVDTAESKKTLREVAKRSLDDEIRQLQEELDLFDPEKVRQSTLERKLQGFDDLRARANLFARVLSFKATAMNERIAAIQAGLRGQLGGRQQKTVVEIQPVQPADEPTKKTPPDVAAFEPFSAAVGF